jgi:NTE family protein
VNIALPRRTALVLGGGGLKGFAHIGVLRALEERGIVPTVFAGTSIGAMIAAAHAGGMSLDQMEQRALDLRRRDLFRLNHMGMLLERMRSPSLYLEEPLRELCETTAPSGTFEDLNSTLLVNTVDVERGTQVVWGLPGLRDVRVADAVYASCALPGFFPPGYVDGRTCIDGGTVDNLPAGIAGSATDAVIAVDVGNTDVHRMHEVLGGFASIYVRAAQIMMHSLQQKPLASWQGPPMLLIRPAVAHVNWLSFNHTPELVQAGYEAAADALDRIGELLCLGSGVYPRRRVQVVVDRDRCISCQTCVAMAPHLMAMDAERKAYAIVSPLEWSPADGEFVHHCPTTAISVETLDGSRRTTTEPTTEPTLEAADD